MIVSFNSNRSEHPNDINITLKDHQLAMLHRCKEIEETNELFGIMNDKPGTGKTYVILSLIYESRLSNKTNIIVVPQNIYSQWVLSIENYSKKLSYKKFIDYQNIISLYSDPNILTQTDIILITSSYYHIIATTLESLNIKINRVFFDEIDSISNIICTKINSDFTWFVSATFDINLLGYYQNKIKNIEEITCKCDDDFIDSNLLLDPPIKKYYLCKNIYIDNILGHVLSNNELKSINALDYTLNNKDFENKKVKNEKDVIDIILANRKSLLIFDKINVEESNKNIILYEDFKLNKDVITELFLSEINKLDEIINFKENVLKLISNYSNLDFYINIINDDLEEQELIQYHRKEEIKILRTNLEEIIDIIYNLNEIESIFRDYYNNRNNTISFNNIIIKLKSLEIIINGINDILVKIKNRNEKEDKQNTDLIIFLNKYFEFNIYLKNLLLKIFNYDQAFISDVQLDIYKKLLSISTKNIEENERKINLIYDRLKESKCCPICYFLYNDINNNKIYISQKCCNNKICGECVDKWYDIGKKSCIFCNKEDILKDDFIFFEKDITEELQISDVNENLMNENLMNENIIFTKIENSKNIFLKEYIESIKNMDKKIIIFSDYSNIFSYIEYICDENEISYIDLDKGNIKDIDYAVNEYKYGNVKILLSNSTLFGCGMNFENASDIIFVHKMDFSIEKQVIGRAQRIGRKEILNIIYLEHENESIFNKIKNNNSYIYEDELNDYYNTIQCNNIINNLSNIEFNNIDYEDNNVTTLEIPPISSEIIDVNLDNLIESLI